MPEAELQTPVDFPDVAFALPRVEPLSLGEVLVQWAPFQALSPIPVLLLVAPVLYFFFRKTWQELDEEARQHHISRTAPDYRPAVCLSLVAVTLTLHHYYGGRSFYLAALEPQLRAWELAGHSWLRLDQFSELYGFTWWVTARILGYVVVPLLVWRMLFRQDSILDMGLRVRGFFSHLWIYGLAFLGVLVAMWVVARQSEFVNYYPFYKKASRSWFDLLAWESMYFLQFFALEFFFRGWMLQALRKTMGAAAVFVMAVPYCMIHYGKPYMESHGAILAGIFLGSLAMRTKSIYAGFLLHITVAGLMDALALYSRHGFPTRFWP